MKERLINVLKVFLMILGVLFIIQLLIGFGVILGLVGFANAPLADIQDFGLINTDKKLKQIQPIIKYVDDYRIQNGKYPKEVNGVKLKKNLEYQYETTNDGNCYTITLKSKKDNLVKQYQYCSIGKNDSTSKSQSYVEYTSK